MDSAESSDLAILERRATEASSVYCRVLGQSDIYERLALPLAAGWCLAAHFIFWLWPLTLAAFCVIYFFMHRIADKRLEAAHTRLLEVQAMRDARLAELRGSYDSSPGPL